MNAPRRKPENNETNAARQARLRAALLPVVPGEAGRVSAMPGAVLSGSIRDEVKSGFPAGVESPKEAGATGREFRLRRSDIGQPQAQRNALGNLQPLARRGGCCRMKRRKRFGERWIRRGEF